MKGESLPLGSRQQGHNTRRVPKPEPCGKAPMVSLRPLLGISLLNAPDLQPVNRQGAQRMWSLRWSKCWGANSLMPIKTYFKPFSIVVSVFLWTNNLPWNFTTGSCFPLKSFFHAYHVMWHAIFFSHLVTTWEFNVLKRNITDKIVLYLSLPERYTAHNLVYTQSH